MAFSSYTPHFVAIIPQTWPPRVILLALWTSYLQHGLLDLYSSFCGHHTSNMASSRYAPRFVATIPQTWPPQVILLVLWPSYLMASSTYTPRFVATIPQTWPPRDILLVVWLSYLKHGLLELYFSFCGHYTSSMASTSYICLK
jgi:hypothetical protein